MENCWEQPPHSSQDYYPHYNLFQSSIFYDTDNFRVSYLSYRYGDCSPTESGTRCCEEVERSAEPPDKSAGAEAEAAASPGPGAAEPRVITKEELYTEPDHFKNKNEEVQAASSPAEPPFLADPRPWGYDWTRQSWVKAGRGAVVMRQKGERKEWRSKQLYNQLANAPRVSISKAETMMQKMGWQGGALGKTSDGILDPVAPDTHYVFGTAGFGQRTTSPPAPAPAPAPAPTKPPRRMNKRDAFRTNVLTHVLRFVQDDTEIEMYFDETLRQHERRFIHALVHNVITDGNVASLSCAAQYGLAADIGRCNQYDLCTVSDGEPPHRQMCIYKEAPEHVYLVTPSDLQPKDESIEPNAQSSKDNHNKENDATKIKNAEVKDDKTKADEETASMDMDDDENPFLKSIKKSIKKDDEPKSISNKFEKDCNIAKEDVQTAVATDKDPMDVEAKMLEFFLEFADAKEYDELRFLGKFTAEQMAVVNDLLNEVAACVEDLDGFEGREEILKVFKGGKVSFELKEGRNGTIEIHKVSLPRT